MLLRLNSRESEDWLIPTIRAISFLGHFLCSKAKICDLCSEVSCLYIRNTKIINLRESSKGDSFLYCRYRSSGLRAPAARPTRGVFHRLEPMEKRMICCTSILKVRISPRAYAPTRASQVFRLFTFTSSLVLTQFTENKTLTEKKRVKASPKTFTQNRQPDRHKQLKTKHLR